MPEELVRLDRQIGVQENSHLRLRSWRLGGGNFGQAQVGIISLVGEGKRIVQSRGGAKGRAAGGREREKTKKFTNRGVRIIFPLEPDTKKVGLALFFCGAAGGSLFFALLVGAGVGSL